MTIKLRGTGEVCGKFTGLTSSRTHGPMAMGTTVVQFRDSDGVPWELPLTEVAFA
jgi:hypothetical protein